MNLYGDISMKNLYFFFSTIDYSDFLYGKKISTIYDRAIVNNQNEVVAVQVNSPNTVSVLDH